MFAWGALLDFVIFPGEDYMYLKNDPLSLKINIPYHALYGIILVVYIALFYIINFVINKIKSKKSKPV